MVKQLKLWRELRYTEIVVVLLYCLRFLGVI